MNQMQFCLMGGPVHILRHIHILQRLRFREFSLTLCAL